MMQLGSFLNDDTVRNKLFCPRVYMYNVRILYNTQ
jgi:hypothetical protein